MALSRVGVGKITNQNLYKRIEETCNSSLPNSQKATAICDIFTSYRNNVILPELVEILKIMYDGDVSAIKRDIISAKLTRVEGRKDDEYRV